MADYGCCNPRSMTSSPLQTAVSTSQTLPSSNSESMWEGWTQSSPVSQNTISEQLQQQLGGAYSSTTNMKSGSSYQHDLLSSWLMSGYQTVSLNQQQEQHHGGEEGSGTTTMYQDEFSRINICSSTVSSNYHGVTSPPVATATGGGSDSSHQFYDVIQTCSSKSGLPNEVGESSQILTSPPSPDHHKFLEASAHKLDVPLDVNANQKIVNQMNATTELSSRASSSSPSGLNSYGQTMLQQQKHLGGQFDSSTYWASTGSTTGVTSSSPQPSDCSGGGGMHSSGQQREEQQPNTSCDSTILHHQQQHSSKNRCEDEDTLFHNSGTDLSADEMYNELHGLFGKSLETPEHGGAVDSDHQRQLAICSDGRAKSPGSYGDHSSWSQFTANPSLSGISPHAGGFMGVEEVVDRTTFDSSTTPDSLCTVMYTTTRRDELSLSSAGTAISAIHNFRAGASGSSDLGQAQLPYRTSSSVDLDCSDIGLQRKRSLFRGNEQVGDSGVSAADDSVKRSRIVRCLWDQNIAQLQLANLPPEHHRNLWQLQSQAVFGRIPGNFLMGGSSSSNSGSMDMTTAVGPALNTNGRPRARRGSATDPQSVYARHRRERINDRLKVLQHLVPNGAKVDNVTMLEETINYVKFLQLQVRRSAIKNLTGNTYMQLARGFKFFSAQMSCGSMLRLHTTEWTCPWACTQDY